MCACMLPKYRCVYDAFVEMCEYRGIRGKVNVCMLLCMGGWESFESDEGKTRDGKKLVQNKNTKAFVR